MDESVALEKKNQTKFAKKVKKVKERVQASGEPVELTKNKPLRRKRGVVYVGHIPHGFYENEMLAYFKQFGKVGSIRLCRSKKTGRSKGYAFIEFADAEVAKIVADTMDNYLMFNKRLEAKYIAAERPQRLRKYTTPSWSVNKYPLKLARKKATMAKNQNTDKSTHLVRTEKYLAQVNKNLRRLQQLGINYSFKPVDIPSEIRKKVKKASENKTNKKDNVEIGVKQKRDTIEKASKNKTNNEDKVEIEVKQKKDTTENLKRKTLKKCITKKK